MRIVIIDDDRLSIFLTESLLIMEDATHKIKTFLSGTATKKQIPNIILLDLIMPVMDGWYFFCLVLFYGAFSFDNKVFL
ncbi:response regulator [Pontibacter harenae]|uniref:response regulator n=1 Tax=Pontibacter harenae TaxID=2894083 RepID=UPI001E2E2A35|nr:hypothetical protein [Pontibacter harenae]MCC9169104.1 hypothetical protein [Pontibacter harenae]